MGGVDNGGGHSSTSSGSPRHSAIVVDGNGDNDARFSFAVTLVNLRKNCPLGWQLDALADNALYVCEVSSSPGFPLHSFNSTAPDHLNVKVGDYIREVNGRTSALAEQVSSHDLTMRFVVQRPLLVTRRVRKDELDAKLGLSVVCVPSFKHLFVEGVSDGWVKRSAPDIRPGDRILEVGVTRGAALELKDVLCKSTDVNLLIS